MFSFLRPNSKLTPAEESDEILKFAHYKRRIIGTSAYDQSSDYELLHSKVRELLQGLLGRHRRTLVPPEAEDKLRASPRNHLEEDSGAWRVRRDLELASCDSSMLMALAMLSYMGAEEIDGLRVSQNRFFTNRAIEYLVAERAHSPALLAKALLLMYGFQEYLPPDPEKARAVFQRYGYSDRSIQDEISLLSG